MTKPRNNVTEQTLDQFKEQFIKECARRQTNELEMSYDELSKTVGLSKGATFKAIEALVENGFLEKITAASRRFPNKYILTGPVEVPGKSSRHSFRDGNHFIDSLLEIEMELAKKTKAEEKIKELLGDDPLKGALELIEEMEEYKKKYENLKAVLGKDIHVEAMHTLPGGLRQLIYKEV